MMAVLTVARMTFLEARRNKVTWSLLFFCVILVLTSFLFEEVTFVAPDRLMRDVGMGAINLFGVALSIFLGVSVVTREVERRTAYTVLTKPLGRAQYLLGKLAGVWVTVAVSLAMMLAVFLVENALWRGPFGLVLLQAFWLMLMEFLVLASFSILASTFTSSIMSTFMSAGLFLIGHLSPDLYFFAQRSKEPTLRAIGTALYYALPDLEKLNLKTQVSLMAPVTGSAVLASTAYALIFVAAFFVLSAVIFSRRDLK